MLHRTVALLLIAALALQLTGCTASRPRSLPGQNHVDDTGDAPPVEVGDEVTIDLVDGASLAGTVLAIHPDRLVLVSTGNYGREEIEVLYTEIDRVTVGEATAWGKAAVWGMAVLALAGIAIAVIGATLDIGDLS